MLKSLIRSIVGRFTPTITMAPDTSAPTISPVLDKMAPSASVHAPTIADHLQRRHLGHLDQSVHDRIAIERFNAWHARAGTGIWAVPTGMPSHTIDAPTAAISFVRWAAENQLADEMKVDDLWLLASGEFAPARKWFLPPRRVFLGALQRVPGVKVVYDRRIYGRNGRVLGKTTFYTLVPRPVASASALSACAEELTGGGTGTVSKPVAGNTTPTVDPMPGEMREAHPASFWIEPAARPPRRPLACEVAT